MSAWTVTRQTQWPDGTKIVEISRGGIDYTNPDALVQKYPGELETFADPREAVTTALAIAKAWQADAGRSIAIGHGGTGGMTMPFEGDVIVTKTAARGIRALRKWAQDSYDAAPKCDNCPNPLPEPEGRNGGPWRLIEDPDQRSFCSENCADQALEADQQAQAELDASSRQRSDRRP